MPHIKEEIEQLVARVSNDLGITKEIKLQLTTDFNHGDFTSNIALMVSHELKRKPIEIAEDIVRELIKDREFSSLIKSATVAGPGFINIFLSDKVVAEELKKAFDSPKNFGSSEVFKNQEVLIEYTQPNPLKVFHIGHLMSNAIGESLSRLYEDGGAEVKRLNYQGDVGLHIGKALWGMKKLIDEMPIDNEDISVKTSWLGKAYVLGARAYEEDEIAQEEIHSINKAVYEKDDNISYLYEKGKEWSLAHFEEIYSILGTNFDRYYFESETSLPGLVAVKENTPSIFKESDGAIVYPGEDEGLHTRVFVTSRGLPAYEAKDLGLCILKNNEFPTADVSIVVTAEEQREYMKVVKAAVGKIIPTFAEKFIHITHGMMNLSTGKMSSRKGNVISGESMIFEAIRRVNDIMKERGYGEEEQKEIAQAVAVAAVKFPILRQALGRNIAFDFETALSMEGDTGVYVQYARVRARSVLNKAANIGQSPYSGSNQDEVSDLERHLVRLTYAIERAQIEREPHHVATYLMQLAQMWNSYYGNTKIIGEANSSYRLMIAQITASCIERGMYLLGMSVPENM